MKIIADDKIPYLKGVLEPFSEIIYVPGSEISRKDLMDADALITRTITRCNEDLLKDTPVQFIGSATIGFDHIDTDWCNKQHIQWTNAPGCNATSVVQYIASALVNLEKKEDLHLNEKTLGIIGVGHVGSRVAKMAEHLGMRVLLNDPPRAEKEGNADFVSLDRIKNESDIISVHVSLNKEGKYKTLHLLNDYFFNSINKKTYLINSSRGAVVQTKALKLALQKGQLSGAILDVWENEPTIDRDLLEQVIFATPHIAGYSTEGKANGTSMVVRALSNHFHFDLNDWFPEKLLTHDNMLINLDCSGLSEEEIIFEMINKTFNIKEDDKRLRNSIHTFEKQRGNYPVRREFPAYELRLTHCPDRIKKVLHQLNFNISIV